MRISQSTKESIFCAGSLVTRVTLIICIYYLGSSAYGITISSFNPILSDFAEQIGKEKVTIHRNLSCTDDPHHFEPTPDEIKQLDGADIVLFAGKNLETFKSSITNQLNKKTTVVEAGKYIPSLTIEGDSEFFVCCPTHAHGAIDPHWWHSVLDSKRACQTIYKAFAKKDPTNKSFYLSNLKDYLRQLDQLHDWAVKELSFIPSKKRKLVTAHAAFAYFCRDYDFKALPVLGLSTQDQPTPGYIETVVKNIRKKQIDVIFPQKGSNPKILDSIITETGARIGIPLLTDTPHPSEPLYISMMRHNVRAIVTAFK